MINGENLADISKTCLLWRFLLCSICASSYFFHFYNCLFERSTVQLRKMHLQIFKHSFFEIKFGLNILHCFVQSLKVFGGKKKKERCIKLDRQHFPILDHLLRMVHFISFHSYGLYKSASKHVIWIQYLNTRIKFRYPFPHPKFLCYLWYRMRNTLKERRKIKEKALVAYWNGDSVDVYNLGTV